jgi:hypothetical protein
MWHSHCSRKQIIVGAVVVVVVVVVCVKLFVQAYIYDILTINVSLTTLNHKTTIN